MNDNGASILNLGSGNHSLAERYTDLPSIKPLNNHNYDPSRADECVKISNLFSNRRFWQMFKTVAAFCLASTFQKTMLKRTAGDARRMRAQRLRETLILLGETFIKLGQFLSVRRDFLPVEIADELSLLQDQVPSFSFKLVEETVRSDLGQAPEEIFDYFERIPLASASIGQVHKARLKDGQLVVVKVQRPDLSQRFYQDLGCMRLLARIGQRVCKGGQWDNWLALSDQFGRTLFSEIDYIQEGRNADRARRLMRDHLEIRIPRVYWRYTGRRVLTLEFLPGTKIDCIEELQARNIDLAKIGNELISSYLDQVLLHGFFHADPHAGNLSVDNDGKIIIYDFGMMGEITEAERDAMMGAIVAIMKKNTGDLVQHLKELKIIIEDKNLQPIARTLQALMEYYAGRQVKDLDFSKLEKDLDRMALDRALSFPPTLAYLLRAGTSLEGIARTLQPNFNFVEAAKPFLKKWLTMTSSFRAIFSGASVRKFNFR